MREVIISQRLPVLALRGICVFPEMVVHFDAGRDRSIRAVDEAVKHGQEIFLATQRDIDGGAHPSGAQDAGRVGAHSGGGQLPRSCD